MRTTVTLDDDLVTRASELTGITERSALLRAGLETLVRVESARRLAALGGTDTEAGAAPRRTRDRQAPGQAAGPGKGTGSVAHERFAPLQTTAATVPVPFPGLPCFQFAS